MPFVPFIPSAITCDIGKRVYSLMTELVAIPSVDGSEEGENACARFIFDWLSRLDYFKRNPKDLRFITLENDPLSRRSVGALLRAATPTKKTVILTGHLDVVDVDVYGSLREWAFDPAECTRRMGGLNLPEDVRSDLESGNYVFGRGVSDMKTGLALSMCLLEDYAALGEERDFNVLFLAVPDEEGDSAGMRGSVPFIADLQEKEGLDFLLCVNMEPVFDVGVPAVYYGSIGMSTLLYLCVGRESHVGEYYEGLNSTLIASYLNISMEGRKEAQERLGRQIFPPECCLYMRDARDRYAVTLPERSVLYYNCLTVEKTPPAMLEAMKAKAMSALNSALSHVGREDWEPRVLTVQELIGKAVSVTGEEKLFAELPPPQMDERERNAEFLFRALDAAGEKGPLVVVGFVPPYYPPRVNRNEKSRERAIRHAAGQIAEDLKRRKIKLMEIEAFPGISDLSYTGFQGGAAELDLLAANLPLWGRGYDLPLEDLRKLDLPCVILGPVGKDAHKFTERVELDYSFNVLPSAVKKFIALILRESAS